MFFIVCFILFFFFFFVFFFQAEDGIRDDLVTGVQTCALPISSQTRGSVSKCWQIFIKLAPIKIMPVKGVRKSLQLLVIFLTWGLSVSCMEYNTDQYQGVLMKQISSYTSSV